MLRLSVDSFFVLAAPAGESSVSWVAPEPWCRAELPACKCECEEEEKTKKRIKTERRVSVVVSHGSAGQ